MIPALLKSNLHFSPQLLNSVNSLFNGLLFQNTFRIYSSQVCCTILLPFSYGWKTQLGIRRKQYYTQTSSAWIAGAFLWWLLTACSRCLGFIPVSSCALPLVPLGALLPPSGTQVSHPLPQGVPAAQEPQSCLSHRRPSWMALEPPPHTQIPHNGSAISIRHHRSSSQTTTQFICAPCSCHLPGITKIQKPQVHGQSPQKQDTSGGNLTHFKSRHVGCGSEAAKSLARESNWFKFCSKYKKKIKWKTPLLQRQGYGWTTENSGNREDILALEEASSDTTGALCLIAAQEETDPWADDVSGPSIHCHYWVIPQIFMFCYYS